MQVPLPSSKISPEQKKFRALYAEQLPKRSSYTLKDILYITGLVIGSINVCLVAFGATGGAPMWTVLAVICAASMICSLGWFKSLRRRWRAADAIMLMHYAAHCARDCLASYGKEPVLEDALKDIINTAARAMSIVNNAHCYASIKELNNVTRPDGTTENMCHLVAVCDDYEKKLDPPEYEQFPSKSFTSIDNLLSKQRGCSRYYLCNDVKNSWKERHYNNPIVERYLEPSIGWRGRLLNWNLPFKSTLVVPVRYTVCDHDKIKADYIGNTRLSKTEYDESIIHGMLCFDCVEKNAFDRRYSVELAAGFADILYILLTQLPLVSGVSIKGAEIVLSHANNEQERKNV